MKATFFSADLPHPRAFVQGRGSICNANDFQTLFTHRGTIISFPSERVSRTAYEFVTPRPVVIKKSSARDFKQDMHEKSFRCVFTFPVLNLLSHF